MITDAILVHLKNSKQGIAEYMVINNDNIHPPVEININEELIKFSDYDFTSYVNAIEKMLDRLKGNSKNICEITDEKIYQFNEYLNGFLNSMNKVNSLWAVLIYSDMKFNFYFYDDTDMGILRRCIDQYNALAEVATMQIILNNIFNTVGDDSNSQNVRLEYFEKEFNKNFDNFNKVSFTSKRFDEYMFNPNSKTIGTKKDLENKSTDGKINARRCIRIDPQIIYTIDKACKLFNKNGHTNTIAALEQIGRQAKSDKFSVAVVGEFSKGKSTFINTLLDKEFLPISDLPATAILTRIRHSSKEMLAFLDEKGIKKQALPLSKASWEGYTADNFGNEIIKGTAIVGINDSWLGAYNIELIDTPGAGDLDENRAKLIGDALLGCDAAIITISATAALSQSEKLFIEERLISKKTPFLMLIVTKLDQVPMRERSRLIEYIKGNLELMGIDIPVYIPYDIEMSDDKFSDIIGTDKIRSQIVEWISADKRVELTQQWMVAKAISVIDNTVTALNTQKMLYQIDEEKRDQLIKQKREKISESRLTWNELRIKMLEKENACYEQLLSKADEYSINIKEKLQYEAAHTNNPQKWWTEDYPYRLKIELSNMSVSIENIVSRIISGDIKWFNVMLDKYFKTHISYEAGQITDKDEYKSSVFANEIEFEDIDKKRNITRIGTTVLSLAGAMVVAAAGVYPLIFTMGIGTGSAIITDKVFKGKIEQQRAAINETIEKNIPEIVMVATSESETRLKQVYEDIINEAKKSEEAWFEAQESAIEKAGIPKNKDEFDKIENMLGEIENIKSELAAFVNN